MPRYLQALSVLLLVLCGAFSTHSAKAADKTQPNVILVMTDDQGYGDLSCHGNPILKTPRLDAFAGQSLRLTDFHVAPMCTPTRGQLMSGMEAVRNGSTNVCSGRSLLRQDVQTLGDLFSSNGYHTSLFGKWHLGDNYPYRPQDRGFQHTLSFPGSHIGAASDHWGNEYHDPMLILNGQPQRQSGYCTDIFFDQTMDWIKEVSKDDSPFFAYLPLNAPHWPHVAPESDFNEMKAIIADSEFKALSDRDKKKLAGFLGMIRNIDFNMGRMLDFLDSEGLAENTIVIFTTDNGSTCGTMYYNAGMRGRKTETWEGGHRVPCFIRWPSGEFGDPRDVTGLTQAQDILPTLSDLCGLEKPTTNPVDGISLASAFRNGQNAPEDRALVMCYSPMPQGFNYPSPYSPTLLTMDDGQVMWNRWRLMWDSQLYNLDSDPLQQKNVIDDHPDVARKLKSHLRQWWAKVKDTANEPQRLLIGSKHENPAKLTSSDWQDVALDMQVLVRKGERKNSYWLLDVDQAGEYEFELRRWPRELDLPLAEANGSDTALPIVAARMLLSGASYTSNDRPPFKFEGQTRETSPGDRSVTFSASLQPGPITLHTWFDAKDGNSICGAYYVYITRKSGLK